MFPPEDVSWKRREGNTRANSKSKPCLGKSGKKQKHMFCPECKSEFVEGIKQCPECMVRLVDELPPEPPKPSSMDYEVILASPNPADIAILKSILDSEEIAYFIKGENAQISFATPELMVRADQVEIAKELIKDLKLSCMGTNLDKESRNE